VLNAVILIEIHLIALEKPFCAVLFLKIVLVGENISSVFDSFSCGLKKYIST